MGSFSIWHWLVVGIVLILLFGRGRFSGMMEDIGEGLQRFRRGLSDENDSSKIEASRRD